MLGNKFPLARSLPRWATESEIFIIPSSVRCHKYPTQELFTIPSPEKRERISRELRNARRNQIKYISPWKGEYGKEIFHSISFVLVWKASSRNIAFSYSEHIFHLGRPPIAYPKSRIIAFAEAGITEISALHTHTHSHTHECFLVFLFFLYSFGLLKKAMRSNTFHAFSA